MRARESAPIRTSRWSIFKHLAGVDILHVPYRGSTPALTDLIAGRITMYMVTYSVFDALEKEGKVRIVADRDRGPSAEPARPCRPSARPSKAIPSMSGSASRHRPARRPRSSTRFTAMSPRSCSSRSSSTNSSSRRPTSPGISAARIRRPDQDRARQMGRLVKISGAKAQ